MDLSIGSDSPGSQTRKLAFPSIELHPFGSIWIDGKQLQLTPIEERIFLILFRNQGQVVRTEDLYQQVYGPLNKAPDSNVLRVHLSSLRNKLATAHADLEGIIDTAWNNGYVFAQRKQEPDEPDFVFTVNGFRISVDASGYTWVNRLRVVLAPLERKLMRLLAAHADSVLTERMILEALWDEARQPEINIIKVLACKLRSALNESPHEGAGGVIHTVWGRGYSLRTSSLKTSHVPNRADSAKSAPAVTGARVTLNDLPPLHCRWVPRRKATIVALMSSDIITAEEVIKRYPDLTQEELASWIRIVNQYGMAGLRTTRTQQYA